jgi:hypothetical protein
MNPSQADLDARQLGKFLFFMAVGLFSALCLAGALHFYRREDLPVAFACLLASASLWWPLFQLGRFHARKRRPAS